MGFLSNHKDVFLQTANLDEDIIGVIHHEVEQECINLILRGYRNYLTDEKKQFLVDEEVITAALIGQVERIIENEELRYDIVPELRQYTDDIVSGRINPRKAKRIDISIKNIQLVPKRRFWFESKLLFTWRYESKYPTSFIGEYVGDAGMGKYINNLYKDDLYDCGMMLGYVINGTIQEVVALINQKILEDYSEKEQLSNKGSYYLSNYTFNKRNNFLNHIFLDFSGLNFTNPKI